MAFRKLISWVPEIYYFMLPEVFYREIPDEYFCDCFNCPMTARSSEELDVNLSKPFSPETKCCTFNPRLPNYLVGAILADKDPELEEGNNRIRDRIRSRQGIIPNGIYPSKNYNDLITKLKKSDFGRNSALLCPFFKEGRYNCTIWKYRESVCAFWFCKHLAGNAGYRMWNSVIDYIKFIQDVFLLQAIYKSGLLPVDLYGESVKSDGNMSIANEIDSRQYHEIWGPWEGREPEFYINCFDYIKNLSQDKVNEILEKGKEFEDRLVQELLNVIKLPDCLQTDSKLLIPSDESTYQVEFIHNISPLERSVIWSFQLPSFLLDGFDGKTKTKEVLRNFKKEFRTDVDTDIIISLYHHGILNKACG